MELPSRPADLGGDAGAAAGAAARAYVRGQLLTDGRTVCALLSPAGRRDLAEHLVAPSLGKGPSPAQAGAVCTNEPDEVFDPESGLRPDDAFLPSIFDVRTGEEISALDGAPSLHRLAAVAARLPTYAFVMPDGRVYATVGENEDRFLELSRDMRGIWKVDAVFSQRADIGEPDFEQLPTPGKRLKKCLDRNLGPQLDGSQLLSGNSPLQSSGDPIMPEGVPAVPKGAFKIRLLFDETPDGAGGDAVDLELYPTQEIASFAVRSVSHDPESSTPVDARGRSGRVVYVHRDIASTGAKLLPAARDAIAACSRDLTKA